MRRCIGLILPLLAVGPAQAAQAGGESVGMAVIVLAALIATVLVLRDGVRAGAWTGAYERYRANLGRGILLGLDSLLWSASGLGGRVGSDTDGA